MPKYSIWMSGYQATGESATASYHGEWDGETFLDACAAICFPLYYVAIKLVFYIVYIVNRLQPSSRIIKLNELDHNRK